MVFKNLKVTFTTFFRRKTDAKHLPVNLDEYSTLYSPSGCSTIFAGTSSPVGAENNTKTKMSCQSSVADSIT